LTTNALKNLADTTLENVRAFAAGEGLVNEVK
jgi:D-lactate dehydrogenase